MPSGVLSVVVGASSEIGPALTDSPLIRKLTFTGSTEVGRRLEEACAATLKRTSMELGGNAPFIVFEDADIDAAVEGALISKYRNSGKPASARTGFWFRRVFTTHSWLSWWPQRLTSRWVMVWKMACSRALWSMPAQCRTLINWCTIR